MSFEDILDSNRTLKIFFYFFAAIGMINFVIFAWKLACFICRHSCRGQQDLLTKYSGDEKNATWAVVTGGSDGIGLEFCNQFAAQGFNICIISRNLQKIEAKLAEITTAHPNI